MVEQLCWEKELHNIHSSYDFSAVNGQLLLDQPLQVSYVQELVIFFLSFLFWFLVLNRFLPLQLTIEGGIAIAIFIRCFADKRGIEHELQRKLHVDFPRGVLAAISVIFLLFFSHSQCFLVPFTHVRFNTDFNLLVCYRSC